MKPENFELKNKIKESTSLIPNENSGLAMCTMALSEIFFMSRIERDSNFIRYFQGSCLRAVSELQNGVPHGTLTVFYPDGQVWMRGAYANGVLVSESMKLFMPL